MEERKFSPEQPEEVIELLDIVGDSVSEKSDEQTEESVSGAVADGDVVDDDSEVAAEVPGSDEVVLLEEEAVVLGNDAAAAEERPAAPEGVFSVAGQAREKPENTRTESVPATGSAEGGDDERILALKKEHESEVRALEERIAALEKANAELAENVESLSQQIAQVGTMFLEDASVRLNMEEMVSRMLDARLPSTEDQEEGNSGEEDLAARMTALEKRMQEWEQQSEQKAASAAARVIREEIAAMRAEASC